MAKTAKVLAFGKKILDAEHKFKAKRDEHLLKKLDEQRELLEYWFANTYDDIQLKARVILSRQMNELQVVNKLKFYTKVGGSSIISLEDTVDSDTWYNPYYMEKYIDSFVENHKKSIVDIIDRYNKGI